MTTLFELFKTAEKKLANPILYFNHNGQEVRVSIAEKAKFETFFNYLYITADSEYVGKVTKDGKMHVKTTDDVLAEFLVRDFNEHPVPYLVHYGKTHAYCCFCGTQIRTKESLAVGYGPICAEKWGLPWGETSNKTFVERRSGKDRREPKQTN